jgi:hypothetical protein
MKRPTKMATALAEKAGERLAERDRAGIHPNDILQQARATIVSIARGRGGPRAWERLQAAQHVLSREYLPLLTDEQLLFEVYRRAGPPCRCGGTHVCQPACPA